jgi:hypothetical protein
MSLPSAFADAARFASVTEISTGKLVKGPATFVWLIAIAFRLVHVPPTLYQVPPPPPVAVNPAVTDAAALIVTFCGVAVPVSPPLNPLNVYPAFAVALTATTAPALYHPLPGVIVPPADGLADVVRKYCVVNAAVYVAEDDGAAIVWLAAPPSDQLPNTYCVPAAPACGPAAAIV